MTEDKAKSTKSNKKNKKKPKKPNLRKLVKKAFSLWSECSRILRNDRCEYCGIQNREINSHGKPTVLNVHHLVGRENKALRFDLRNACVLCTDHHKFGKDSAHKGSIFFYEWFRNYRPDDYWYLINNRDGDPVDTVEKVQAVIDDLKATKERLTKVNSNGL